MKGELKGKRYRWKPSECIYFFNRHQHDQCLLVSSLNSAKIKGAGTLMMTHGKSRSISYFPFNGSRDCLIFGLWSFAHSNVRRLFLSLSHIRYIEEGILEAKTECYEKDKVKSPPFFWSFYDDFFWQLPLYVSQNWRSDGHFEVMNRSKS